MTKPLDYLLLLLMPALLSAGQFLFKRAANAVDAGSLSGFVLSLLRNPHFWIALFVYGAATLLWMLVLSRVSLSRAMPFVALTFVIVPLAGAAFFDERLNPLYWIGVLTILAGLYVTVAASRPA